MATQAPGFLIDLVVYLVDAEYFEDVIILHSLLERATIPLSLRKTKDTGFSAVKNEITVNKMLTERLKPHQLRATSDLSQ